MIRSFKCKGTEKLFNDISVSKFKAFERQARRKLAMLNAAVSLDNLKVPPGNRLELLTGNRKGQHSVRINQQWRICFKWKDNDAFSVEIVDYHH